MYEEMLIDNHEVKYCVQRKLSGVYNSCYFSIEISKEKDNVSQSRFILIFWAVNRWGIPHSANST